MNTTRKTNDYRWHLASFVVALLVTVLVEPSLRGSLNPNPAPWLAIVASAAVAVVATCSLAIWGRGIARILGIPLALGSVSWLLLSAHAIIFYL
jgi:hypothetical protein